MAETVVLLGNTNPIDAAVDGNAVTVFRIPEGVGRMEAVKTVTDVYDPYHSSDPPEWVESSNDRLAQDLAEFWTWKQGDPAPGSGEPRDSDHTCLVGRPDGWQGVGDHLTLDDPDAQAPAPEPVPADTTTEA